MEIDHVAFAVRRLNEAAPRWESALGVRASPPEAVPGQRVRVAFLATGHGELELLEPTEEDSPVSRFLASRGEGMHHIAFRVPSVDTKLSDLSRQGLKLVDRVGRLGARGRRVGFAHPSAFGGVLVEFVEQP